MAKFARFSVSSKPLARPATIMMGISAVSGLLLSAVINSLPDIFGICMLVTIRAGRMWDKTSRASSPLVADSTMYPRSSRKRHTVYRINIESSTTRATIDIYRFTEAGGPKLNVVLRAPLNHNKARQRQQATTLTDSYNRHKSESDCRFPGSLDSTI